MRTSLPITWRDRPCVLRPGEAAAESRPSRPLWGLLEQLLGPAGRWSPHVARRSMPQKREQKMHQSQTPQPGREAAREAEREAAREAEREAERGVYVGIDVAKGALDVAVRPAGTSWRSGNDEAGRA